MPLNAEAQRQESGAMVKMPSEMPVSHFGGLRWRQSTANLKEGKKISSQERQEIGARFSSDLLPALPTWVSPQARSQNLKAKVKPLREVFLPTSSIPTNENIKCSYIKYSY